MAESMDCSTETNGEDYSLLTHGPYCQIWLEIATTQSITTRSYVAVCPTRYDLYQTHFV